ncbi:AT-rich interactive domain-containing protein 4A isoform X2 [Cephus cinctus]|uniref:AT-rich interactive domain-containing protein 4A isoform X2 n=1 Tax=Cephus cinctus TaxID=211228 RepID=A0AAJ7RDE0_CEPCN|nr:AT-rich interactive domain-containing protein 4A isoform X2 [Cephus cinctus]
MHSLEGKRGDDPPYLSVGTEVSAKYKGAFCEAKIRKVVRSVKCRVTYKQGLGTATVTDDQIKGTLRVGASIEAKYGERKDFVEATITKIQDCSQYTVVFDDGDITTLRRTALCLKSGRHFAESETLDQLPLTHPEHFGNPVIGGRRGRRSRDDSSEDEESPPRGSRDSGSGSGGKEGTETEPEIGRVVCVELGDKKKKDNWFPGLVVAPTAQDTVRIRVRDDYLVRSFKDARYYTVPKKEATEFTKELVNKVENSALKIAVEKALLFLEKNDLPPHWDRDSLFGNAMSSGNSDSDGELDSDSSDDEPREEKDHFVAQLYKFMDDRGTPINNCPMIGNEDIDLYRLFRAVYKLGGYNRVTNQNQWKSITRRLSFSMPSTSSTHNLVKQAYKKFLHSFEDFYRKLGCTMVNHPRGSTRKQRPGRSLIRDRDRNTPVPPQMPMTKSEKEEEDKKIMEDEKKEVKKEPKKEIMKEEEPVPVPIPVITTPTTIKIKKKEEFEESGSGQDSDINVEAEGESSSSEKSLKTPTRFTPVPTKTKSKNKEETKKKPFDKKRNEPKKQEKKDEKLKEDEAAKTRSKSKDDSVKGKASGTTDTVRETRTPSRESEKKAPAKQRRLTDEELRKQRGRKRKENELEKSRPGTDDHSSETAPCYKGLVELGDRLKVYYGPTHESKVTYEAKVIDMEKDGDEPAYLVHYTGWNTRYDEWIKGSRIAQNFTQAQGRVKRTKATPRPQTPSATSSSAGGKSSKTGNTSNSNASQNRRRAQSVAPSSTTSSSGITTKDGKKEDKDKEGSMQPTRSTTPLSVTSSSSRTKSPATPAANRLTRLTRNTDLAGVELRRRTRRMSGHTDISVASESEDSEAYESDTTEPEQAKTRSRGTEERKRREVRRRAEDRIKPEDMSEPEEDKDASEEPRRGRRLRRIPGKIQDIKSEPESDEDQPKGRDFDLNQIRSELKGFDKAVKLEIVRSDPDPEEEAKSEEKENEGKPAATPSASLSPKLEKPKLEPPKLEPVPEIRPLESTEDIYEFKEPEPFEFEVRNKRDSNGDKDKAKKRVFDEEPKSPKKKQKTTVTAMKETKPADTEVDIKKRVRRPFIKRIDDGEILSPSKVSTPSACEEAFDKLRESSSFSQPKVQPIPEESGKVANTIDLLFSDLPGDEDGAPDDPEDRLIISETEVSEAEQENLFTYQQEIFPTNDIPDTMEFNRDEVKSQSENPNEETATTNKIVTKFDDVNQKQNVKSPATSRPSPILETKNLDVKSLISSPAVSPALLTPAPISARLPATSTIEEKMAAAAMAFKNKSKETKKEEDMADATKKSLKETSKKMDAMIAKRNREEQNKAKIEAENKKREEEEALKKEEEQRREAMRAAIKQKEEELQQLKLKKEAELKKAAEAKAVAEQRKVQERKEEERKKKEEEINKKEEEEEQHKERDQRERDKRKKVISQEFVDSTDSSDSDERLVIDNEEPQDEKNLTTNFDVKLRAELERLQDIQEGRSKSQTQSQSQLQVQAQSQIQQRSQPQSQSQPQLQLQSQIQPQSQSQSQVQQSQPLQQVPSQPQIQSQQQQKSQPPLQPQAQIQQQQQQQSSAECKLVGVLPTKIEEEGENMSSLLCEEEIPGSPAPVVDNTEQVDAHVIQVPPKIETSDNNIVLLEMPFASAPSSSQSTTCSTVATLSITSAKNGDNVSVPVSLPVQQGVVMGVRQQQPQPLQQSQKQPQPQQQQQQQQQHQHPHQLIQPLPPAAMPVQRRESNEAAPVMDNTPPTTPDSSISNISGSPREERMGGSSPMSEDNLKSNRDSSEADNDSGSKGPGFSEDDTLLNSEGNVADRSLKPPTKRTIEDAQSPKKRKRNRKHSECGSNSTKKSTRQAGRTVRHGPGSDSDDTSESSNLCGVNSTSTAHTNIGSVTDLNTYSTRSPRPMKYNFYVELDPELDGSQRIAVLQQKLSELRKTYNAVKVELAGIERRRKKLRRREREAMKAAKAEMQQACS